jgi:hypothetical protein
MLLNNYDLIFPEGDKVYIATSSNVSILRKLYVFELHNCAVT